MPCTSPKRIWQTNLIRDKYTWKPKVLTVTDPDSPYVHRYEEQVEQNVYRQTSTLIFPRPELPSGCDPNDFGIFSTLIPCGQCMSCRLEYARQWANRIMLEALEYDLGDGTVDRTEDVMQYSYFVTLTYDNDNIADHCLSYPRSLQTGEADLEHPVMSLNPSDLQNFIKRLRDRLGYAAENRIRFFACGEYGEGDRHNGKSTFRPHYHIIFFNLRLPDNDLKQYKRSQLGYDYKNSTLLSECWPYGFNIVAPLTWESACYTARYVLKKAKGDEAIELYDQAGLVPPFVRMSRRPGLASNYYRNHPDCVDGSKISIGTANGSKTFEAPKYFSRLQEFDALTDCQYDDTVDRGRATLRSIDERKDTHRASTANRISHIIRKESKPYTQYLAENIAINQQKAIDILNSVRHKSLDVE